MFFLYWLWWLRYFLSKVNIWNVNCAWATTFILDTRTDVLVKVSKHTYMHTTYIYAYTHICLLLIFMLWNRQATFESRYVVFLYWMQDSKLGCLRHQIAGRLNAHSQTDWAIEDQTKTWTQQPVPMMSEHSAHWASLPIGFHTRLGLSN